MSLPSSVIVHVQSGLCQTWSEIPNTDFLATRLKLHRVRTVNRVNSSFPKDGHGHYTLTELKIQHRN